MSAGIDYGLGRTNINHETGIRFGVISIHSVTQAWCDEAQPEYGEPTCGKCGNPASDSSEAPDDVQDSDWFEGMDYYCSHCKRSFWSDDAFGDEPQGWTVDDGEYKAVDCLVSDIMILSSPYYTFAPFCSPCVPGAGDLDSADESGVKTYCFGHDWFEGGKAPYTVYRVSDDAEVAP